MVTPVLEIGFSPIIDRVYLIAAIQSLGPMPKITVDISKVVMNVSNTGFFLIKVAGGENFPIIPEGEIREALMVHLPPFKPSPGIYRFVLPRIVSNDEISNALHQCQEELTSRFDIVCAGFRPLAEAPYIAGECLDSEGHTITPNGKGPPRSGRWARSGLEWLLRAPAQPCGATGVRPAWARCKWDASPG